MLFYWNSNFFPQTLLNLLRKDQIGELKKQFQ